MTAGGWSHCSVISQISANCIWATAVFLTFAGQSESTNASDPALYYFIQQHLNSIGSPEAFAGVRFRLAGGIGKGTGDILKQKKHRSGSIYGSAELAAGPDSLRLTIQCDSPRYPVEGFFLDKDKFRVAVLDGHESGLLGKFLAGCEDYVKEGLIGGVLSTLWPLLKADTAQRKMKLMGEQKLDGQRLLAVRYSLGGQERVALYFDPNTSCHVATKCIVEMKEGYWTLMEKFTDVRTYDGLNLPTHWTLALHGPRKTFVWTVRFENITHSEGPVLERPPAAEG